MKKIFKKSALLIALSTIIATAYAQEISVSVKNLTKFNGSYQMRIGDGNYISTDLSSLRGLNFTYDVVLNNPENDSGYYAFIIADEGGSCSWSDSHHPATKIIKGYYTHLDVIVEPFFVGCMIEYSYS